MSLGHWMLMGAMTVRGLVILVSLVVVGKAVIAYRQHASRPMLLLGGGLFLLLVGAPAFEFIGGIVFEGATRTAPFVRERTITVFGAFSLFEELLRLAGIGAILASLYVRADGEPGASRDRKG